MMSQPNDNKNLEELLEEWQTNDDVKIMISSAAGLEAFEKAIQDEVDAIWGISSEEEPESPCIIVVGQDRHVPPGILAQVRMVETTCKPIETKVDVDNMISDVFRNIEREAIQRKKLEESFQKDMAVMKAKDYGVSTTIVKDKKPKYRNRKKPWRRTF